MGDIVTLVINLCPKCGGKSFKYHPVNARKTYKNEIVIGKYECKNCGAQFDS